MANPMLAPLIAFLSRLKFPMLFKLTAALFLLDVVIPDMIPFADELLLAMGTMVLGSWKRRREPLPVEPRP